MTVTIHALLDTPRFKNGSSVALAREDITILVRGITDMECNLRFVDDIQLGFIASSADPRAVAREASNLGVDARVKIADLVAFAVANNLAIDLTSADDELRDGGRPKIQLCDERYLEPTVAWTQGHAWDAFIALGLPADPEDNAFVAKAQDVLKALISNGHKIPPRDRSTLSRIAQYAIEMGGVDAQMIAV